MTGMDLTATLGWSPADDRFGPDSNYLGNPKVIEAMLRLFLHDVSEEQGKDQPDIERWVADRIQKDVLILLGRSNDAAPISDEWNSPGGGIVRKVSSRYQIEGTPEEIMAVPFYRLIETMVECKDLMDKGEDWEHLMDGDLETAVKTFLGIDDQAPDL
jgi:hypothetical protein